ncbi:hypothetical protein [Anaerolactibacter massiliensis]|uniref:hypothetical protein n=1 Tax=Anaerolactibacter massiliensis TaxID=2044573 RepID=UPI00107F7C8F|nr:hypothetical protein [Anaerolactibacter massiliensis]
MTKALFSEKQPEVRMTLVDGINQFQICLNEEEVTTPAQSSHTEDDTSEPITQYQYDFNEFRTDALTEEEVKADPEKYLDYTPIASLPEQEQPASIDAALKALQDAQEETAQAVQDMLAATMMEE